MASYRQISEQLLRAYRAGPIPSLRDVLAPTDADGAYAVQAVSVASWMTAGRRIVGHKVGLTAPAVQAQLGVDQPDFGVLFDDMPILNGGVLKAAQVLQPKAEAEVALVLARDVTNPEATVDDIAVATAYAVAAIEIVDSRIADWKITFADSVADNGSSGFFVLGEERRHLAGLDLYTCGMVLKTNGAIASVGAGAACLGHPLNAAAWLARTLIARGDGLKAGEVLLTGALGPMVTLKLGDHVVAEIGGIGSACFTYQA
jgi:2-keto-4-pentenoate hydratase